MIRAYQLEDGRWLGTHEYSPYMAVEGDTEAIVRSIVERTLVWYAERQAKRVSEKPNEVVQMIEPETVESTVSSDETMNFNTVAYGGEAGC